MLHKRLETDRWMAFARPAKKLAVGDRIRFGESSESMACELARLDAEVEAKGEDGEVALRFAFRGPGARRGHRSARRAAAPALHRREAGDRRSGPRDYQTVYAREEGAVAAPTAGLHFTDDLFGRLDERGVARRFVTLHVGAGTFLPVKTEDTGAHRMHGEWG